MRTTGSHHNNNAFSRPDDFSESNSPRSVFQNYDHYADRLTFAFQDVSLLVEPPAEHGHEHDRQQGPEDGPGDVTAAVAGTSSVHFALHR